MSGIPDIVLWALESGESESSNQLLDVGGFMVCPLKPFEAWHSSADLVKGIGRVLS